MADQQRDSSQSRSSNRTGRVGRARQRQHQRERSKELRHSLGQAVSPSGLRSGLKNVNLPKVQTPKLKDIPGKLTAFDAKKASRKHTGRRATAKSTDADGLMARSGSRRKAPRRVPPKQPVVNALRQRTTSSRTSSLLGDYRSRSDRRTMNTNQAKMPPVLIRGGMPDMAAQRTKQSLPKRRYDVTLDVPGAELRLPSLPMVRVGWRVISGILAVMMIACLFMMWKSPAFQVITVEAEGLERLTIGDLNTVMDVMGSSIFTVDPPVIEELLSQAFPELASVSVSANLPAQVWVNVTERQPVLAWFQDGREVWVDAEGVAFTPRGNPGELVRVEGHGIAPTAIANVVIPAAGSLPPDTIYVPAAVVDGSVVVEADAVTQPDTLPIDLVQAILTLGGQVPAETQLVYDSQYGLGWGDPLGWEIYFGLQTSEMEQKLVVYQGVVNYLTHQGLQPELVSVEFIHAPYYRMER